jgi:hypothetical protein
LNISLFDEGKPILRDAQQIRLNDILKERVKRDARGVKKDNLSAYPERLKLHQDSTSSKKVTSNMK